MLPVRPATRSLLFQLAAATLAGLALRPALGLHPVWWWAWLAPAPLLVLAYRTPTRRARGLTALAAVVGVSVNAPYFFQLMPLPAVGLTLVAQTLAWVFVVGASRRLVVRYRAWWTVLAYPVLWAGLDTLEAAGLPDGNWGSLGYSQATFLPALQLTAVLGVAGLLFVVALVPAALALAFTYGRQLRHGWRAYALAGVAVGGTLAYGVARLQNALTPSGPATVFGLAAFDEGIGAGTPATTRVAIEQQYARHVAALAVQGAQVVVLPEKIASLPPAEAAGGREAAGATGGPPARVAGRRSGGRGRPGRS
jgi:apolipoprotein N-acyltransferase